MSASRRGVLPLPEEVRPDDPPRCPSGSLGTGTASGLATGEHRIRGGTSDFQGAMVPSLILQPLVENAIRHGIEPREDSGRIAITARRNHGLLELRVSDNGSGLAEEDGAPIREGIGLSNTRSRLHHLYGDRQRLDLGSVPGGGLEVSLSIPFRTTLDQMENARA